MNKKKLKEKQNERMKRYRLEKRYQAKVKIYNHYYYMKYTKPKRQAKIKERIDNGGLGYRCKLSPIEKEKRNKISIKYNTLNNKYIIEYFRNKYSEEYKTLKDKFYESYVLKKKSHLETTKRSLKFRNFLFSFFKKKYKEEYKNIKLLIKNKINDMYGNEK